MKWSISSSSLLVLLLGAGGSQVNAFTTTKMPLSIMKGTTTITAAHLPLKQTATSDDASAGDTATATVEQSATMDEEVSNATVDVVAPDTTKQDEAAFNELQQIAIAANPLVNYYDPLNLANDLNISAARSKADNIAFLRQAEIKHGRVAMAAFVGYIVQAQGYRWPFSPDLWPSVAGPEAQWDALDTRLKYLILFTVGLLELVDEADPKGHYMRLTKKPGQHPTFQLPTKRSEETLFKGRVTEINNGRLAMLGIMAFVSSSSIPGSVPLLNNIDVPQYGGNFWAPFEAEVIAETVAAASAAV